MSELCTTSAYLATDMIGEDLGCCPTCGDPLREHALRWVQTLPAGLVYAKVEHRYEDPWAVTSEYVPVRTP